MSEAPLPLLPASTPHPRLGYLMAASAATLWALNGIVSKVLLASGFSSLRLTQVRTTGALLGLALAVALRDPSRLRARPRERLFLAAFGILGLAFVQGVVRHAHGFVTVDSAPRKGTTISVYFPAAAAAPVLAPAPAGGGAYTRVAGAALPVGVVAGPTDMADTDRGLPQSMQNRDPGSFCRPQWAHAITFRVASGGGESGKE
jgi:drug/metabolite transporter (DMT)-like permease